MLLLLDYCNHDVKLKMLMSAVDRGFDRRTGQTKDYQIGICCFSSKHAALKSKINDWLNLNQNNVSELSDMSTNKFLFQLARAL